jgi:transposase-like protein
VSRRRYDEQFKADAVELLLSGGRDLKPLARELGVCAQTLRSWRDDYLGKMKVEPGQRSPAEIHQDNQRLRRENEVLQRQRDILKKALGILSEQSPRDMP